MKAGDFVEKRKHKRLDLFLPVMLGGISNQGKVKEREGVTVNVSYNGAYIGDVKLEDINSNDILKISISVPREEARDFPFSRLAGKARVVRVDKDGIAVEFNKDVSRLFIAN